MPKEPCERALFESPVTLKRDLLTHCQQIDIPEEATEVYATFGMPLHERAAHDLDKLIAGMHAKRAL